MKLNGYDIAYSLSNLALKSGLSLIIVILLVLGNGMQYTPQALVCTRYYYCKVKHYVESFLYICTWSNYCNFQTIDSKCVWVCKCNYTFCL